MSFLSNIAWKKICAETCYSMPVFCRSTLTLRYHLQFHSALVFGNETHFLPWNFGYLVQEKMQEDFKKIVQADLGVKKERKEKL